MHRQFIRSLFLVLWLSIPASGQKPAKDPLLAGWLNPPPDCKMRMFWRVFGPAWARDEIDYQFGELKKAGIGGVTTFFFYPVALDNPAQGIKNQRFLSPEFLETLTYATRRAKQMGLRFTVAGGTGWPFGGPTVTPHDAAQRMRRVMIAPEADGSGWKLPLIRTGEKVVAVFRGSKPVPGIDPSEGTALKVVASTADQPLSVFLSGPTGMQVKRPAYGAEGLVIDHYSWDAAKRYLEAVVAPMLKAAPGCIESVFCDSLEVYNSNWTHDFPEQFKKRRGYDLVPFLPALFDDRKTEEERKRGGDGEKKAERPSASTSNTENSPLTTHHSLAPSTQQPNNPTTQDLRFDFWRTLAELTEERFTKPLSEWCHAHGVKLEMEAYGTPPNPLTAAQYIDVPTGEQYEWKGFSFSRWAASGAHLTGKRVIGAEAWTWTSIPNRLADSLADLKLCSDYHFLAGINDLTGVEYPYSPRSAGQPGWLPYFGPAMNQNNPQWPFFHYLVEYVNRCQWMLRQGKPVADVAIYLPVEDKMANGPVEQMPLDFLVRDHFVSGKLTGEFSLKNAAEHHSNLIHTLITHGFTFDGIDFWAMNRLAKVKNGKLICGDGEYRILILPKMDGIDLQALEIIADFVRQGGTLMSVKTIPQKLYGAGVSLAERERFTRTIDMLFGKADPGNDGELVQVRVLDHGQVIFTREDDRGFRKALSRFRPQVKMDGLDQDLTFIHRHTGNRDIFFVANVGDGRASSTLTFRADSGAVGSYLETWDPVTGELQAVNSITDKNHYASVGINLQPRGSVIVVAGPQLKMIVPPGGPEIRAESRRLDGPWRVRFVGPNAPTERTVDKLVSWTEWPDARYFSGRAIYSVEFDWSGPLPREAFMNYAAAPAAGEIRLNGHVAGGIGLPMQWPDVARWIRPGRNRLDISIANLPINRYLGLPDEDLEPLRAVYGNRFPDPQEKRIMKEPAPSGLIGPVSLDTFVPKRPPAADPRVHGR